MTSPPTWKFNLKNGTALTLSGINDYKTQELYASVFGNEPQKSIPGSIQETPIKKVAWLQESHTKVDMQRVLGRHDARLRWIQESLDNIRSYRDENTGFFNVLGDDIVGAFWGETWKAIYERWYEGIKNQARDTIGKLDADLNGKYLTDSEWSQYLRIRGELEKCLGQKLGEPNPFLTMGNSAQYAGEWVKKGLSGIGEFNRKTYWLIIENLPDGKLKTLANAWAGKEVWISKWLWDAFWGVLDLASGMLKYAWSSEYRAHVWKILDITWEYIDKNGYWGTAWNIFSKVWDEMKKINELPLEKQAEAFGRLEGNIAGMIATGWVIGALGKARWAATAASEALSSAAEVAQSAGKLEQAAALGAQASREAMKATIYKIGTFVLNGPAESAIGAVLSNTFRSVYIFLRWGASIADKLKTVEKGIADFSEAMKREKNPENLKYFQEAKEALESEKNKLIQQETELKPRNPSETSTPNSIEAKKFVTEEKSDKQIYRELQQYYNTSRPNSAHHPRAEEIAKELSLIKERMKKWENVRSDLEAIAKDPDAYLKRKNPVEHREMTPHEKFMDGLKKYQEQFSESFLRELAQKDSHAFGEALLHQHTLEEIATLAKNNPEQAMSEFNAFMKSPNQYLAKKFPTPYITVESEIQNYAEQAYAWRYRAEWEKLRASYQKAYEEFLRANPNMMVATTEIQTLADSLRARFKNLAEELDKILASIAESAGTNLKWLWERIDIFLEKIRLVTWMSLSMKSDITNKLRSIKEKYFVKTEKEIPKTERGAQKSATHETLKTEANQEAPHVPEKGLSKFDYKKIQFDELWSNANKFFYDPNIPKPTHKVRVDGKDFLFTNAFESSGNKTVLWYIKVDGKYEPRYFYFSNSGGNWHSAPGVDILNWKNRISKGEQWNPNGYTKWTVVWDAIQDALKSLPEGKWPEDMTQIWKEKIGSLNEPDKPLNRVAEDSQLKDFRERHVIEVSSGSWVDPGTEIGEFQNMHIVKNLDLSFSWWFKKGPELPNHWRFWKIETTIWITNYNGNPVEVIFAHAADKPNLVWVENIRLKDCPIDSHGIPQVIFNGGLLTAKPSEYLSGVPEFIKDNTEIFEQFTLNNRKYVDIRPALQDNPLVVQFKRLNGMRQAA